jgi:hypothetical protein
MLVAAEILVVGMAIFAVGRGSASFAGPAGHVDFSAAAVVPLAAGSAPSVVIDDPNSRVAVSASSDQLVHVRDLTQLHGGIFSSGKYPQLVVTRTADGVRIARPEARMSMFYLFGFSRQAIEVEVPPSARVEIARCSGADVDGVTGGVAVRSVDGHVTLNDLQGSVDARSDDGYVSATNVHGARLTVESMDGHLSFDNVAVAALTGTTRDGRIEANALSVTGDAALQTDDGPVRLHLSPDADLTIDATTRDGSIRVDGNEVGSDDAAQHTIRIGSGTGHMKVETADGSIHIYTNGESHDYGL